MVSRGIAYFKVHGKGDKKGLWFHVEQLGDGNCHAWGNEGKGGVPLK